jgi:prepilin-type N-terminal cleavage/methylation domain-containing protein
MRAVAGGPARRDESGFTLVEILVAITILLVGVLGVTTMIAVSDRTTVINNSRQGATAVVRRALETSRSLSFRSIKSATLANGIQTASPDLATTQAGTWTVARDGYVYTLDATVCRVDDDSDGYGAHDSADPLFCSDNTTTGTADSQPGDYKRVTVTATWTVKGQTRTMKQVTLVPPGGVGDAPAAIDVHPTSPSAGAGQPLLVTTRPSPTSVVFSVTTTNNPGYLSWLIDGTTAGTCPPNVTSCSGSGNAWNFTWSIGTPTIDTVSGSPNQNKCVAPTTSTGYVFDGTYQVGAQPLDPNGLAGTAASTPVTINRCAPIPPPNFNATERDKALPIADVEWDDNPEGDIVGYKVFRGTTITNGTPVCPPNASDPPTPEMHSCIDTAPPAYNKNSAFYYGVYAYDQDPTGAVRGGALSYVEVNMGQNKAPKAPANLAASASGGNVTVSWTIPSSPLDPDAGDTIESFRVYRRAAGATGPWSYTDRLPPDVAYDSMTGFCNGSTTPGASCSFTDKNTGALAHQYMVTSVDSHLRESDYILTGAPTA